MRIEERIVILFSVIDPDKSRLTKAEELLKSGLDWDYLLKVSKQHGVACLLYYHLNRFGFQGYLPPAIFKELESIYYNNCARNTLIYEELARLLSIFEQSQIKVILLKGIFLAEAVYKNIALRQMSDMDILIKKDDFFRIGKVLLDSGYSAADSINTSFNDPLSYSVLFAKVDRLRSISISIDLHWDILTSTWMRSFIAGRVNPEKIWSEASSVNIAGANALALSCQHHLFHLCLHSFSHSFERLILLTDIFEFVRNYQDRIDWNDAREEAKLLGLEGTLSYCLYYTYRSLKPRDPKQIRLKTINADYQRKAILFLIQKKLKFYGLPCLIYILLQNKIQDVYKLTLKAVFLLRKRLLTR
ncbi:MAG: nucleotidyltransferase family protein [Candidatus Omnitrophota bacterium]|nr:nucleotidyltransferase family protein [Candidatus Omnitrophota bacterium]MBU1928467.1 nucleotidyltransferase family protein [Candidatus Omnitrophota bacterium]MBU2035460.1 nucleotidyltransferase family protein [Candidatus Omnitrophota bacterium]MBU2221237.1 nucleotidyltransferase family protein [Candidatus Omnitrophota bacterium]